MPEASSGPLANAADGKYCPYCRTKRPLDHDEAACRVRSNTKALIVIAAVIALGVWYVATFAKFEEPINVPPLTLDEVLRSKEYRCAQLRQTTPPSRLPPDCIR